MRLFYRLTIMMAMLCVAVAISSVFAAVPLVLNHQGRLLDTTDHPITGTYTIIYQIYDAAVGGTLLWTESHTDVQVADGLFTVALGATTPLSSDLLTGGSTEGGAVLRYLQIQIAGQSPILPRTPLSAAPYSVVSGSVSGDIQTSPGRMTANNSFGSKSIAFTSANDSASIAIDESGVHVAKIIADNDSTKLELRARGQHTAVLLNAGADATRLVEGTDVNGDGIPDNSVTSTSSATMAAHAINTKGTGPAGRAVSASSSTSLDAAHSVCSMDFNGDGIVDGQVISSVDSGQAGIAIDEPGVHIASQITKASDGTTQGSIAIDESGVHIADQITKSSDGTVQGNIAIDESGVHKVVLASDGSGFFAGKVGVGKTPVEKIDVDGGAYCDGTNWVNASDANSKENFTDIDGAKLLQELTQLAITKWNYKGNPGVVHIGPTAQDFQATFGVGSDGKSISTIDPAGIALAVAKELSQRLNDKTKKIDQLEAEVQQLRTMVEKLLVREEVGVAHDKDKLLGNDVGDDNDPGELEQRPARGRASDSIGRTTQVASRFPGRSAGHFGDHGVVQHGGTGCSGWRHQRFT